MLFSNNDIIVKSEGGGDQKRPKNVVILNVLPLTPFHLELSRWNKLWQGVREGVKICNVLRFLEITSHLIVYLVVVECFIGEKYLLIFAQTRLWVHDWFFIRCTLGVNHASDLAETNCTFLLRGDGIPLNRFKSGYEFNLWQCLRHLSKRSSDLKPNGTH